MRRREVAVPSFRRSLLAVVGVLAAVLPCAAAPPSIPPLPPRDDTTARWTRGYAVKLADMTRTRVHDAFVGMPLGAPRFFLAGYDVAPPRNATAFVAGSAGPEHFFVAYDAANGVAFSMMGCCSWARAVLDGTLGPPPRRLARAELSGARTRRGLALGDSAARVRALWGAAEPRLVRGRTIYAYWSPIPPKPMRSEGRTVMLNAGCGQSLEAVMEHGRVGAIVIGTEC
jgi:hypothetical protein